MPDQTSVIGVTGATGEIGRRVAARLAARGIAPRLVVRDPSRLARLPDAEVVQIIDYGDPVSMRRALAGLRTLLLVSAKEAANRVQQHLSAIDAALAAGVERIVYLSFMSAAPQATFTFARDHFRTEERIRSAGVAFSFLRPSLYVDKVPLWVGSDGVIRGPAGDGRVTWVARDNIADVAAAVLTGRDYDGRTYDVSGPEALTLTETAEQLSRVVGRQITYQLETLEEARESRRPTGAPAFTIEGWVTSYAAIATGEMGIVSDSVARLAGHDPQSLPDFLAAHPESYHHLLPTPQRP
jgi:uncharacterized protein YbjT (DUF2867 family)